MAQYFENDNTLKSEEKKVFAKIKDMNISFYVDNGVFSKKGLDFGTRTLLENIDIVSIKGDVLDFGCGYGPIGIYLALKTKAKIDMIDINQRSIALAKKNAELNQVNVHIFESNIYKNIQKKYDYIITNPPIRVGKEILYKILLDAREYLKPGGELYLVIHKDQGAKSTMKILSEKYLVTVLVKNKGFYVIKAKLC